MISVVLAIFTEAAVLILYLFYRLALNL
jgi:hypothetical protein